MSSNTQTFNPNAIRSAIAKAIDERILFEEKTQGGDKTKKQLLNMMKEVDGLPNAPLAFSESVSFNWDTFINSHRVSTARCNIYAIPKVWTLMEAIASNRFVRLFDSDPATIATTIQAMGEGIQNEKTIAHRVNSLMTGLRRWQAFNECVARGPMNVLRQYENNKNSVYTYGSGPTQAGSTIRALEGLGLIQNVGKEGNCKLWRFTSLDERTRGMIKAAWDALYVRMYALPSDSPMGKRNTPCRPDMPLLLTGDYGTQEATLQAEAPKEESVTPPVVEVAPTQETFDLLDQISMEQKVSSVLKATPKKTVDAIKKANAPTPTPTIEKPKAGETVSLAEVAKAKKTTPRKAATPKKETVKKAAPRKASAKKAEVSK